MAKYGKRVTGDQKERGALGEISTEDNSGVMTEYSINPQGRGEMPSIVEGMHPADINALRAYEQINRKGGKAEFPSDVEAVAKRSAEKRKAEGKSPFWNKAQDTKKMAKGGSVRGHGCETRGKTKGRFV
jgi:hypothetical protein